MTQQSLTPRALADLLLLGLIWGASFLTIRLALDEVSVLSSVVHRVAWASLVLWAFIWLRGLPVPRSARLWAACLVMGMLNNVLPFTLMAWAQLYIESGLTSILNSATAIFAVIAAALAFADERLTAARAGGVVLGFGGVVWVVGPDALASFDLRSLAQLAVLAGTVSYACAGIWARKFLRDLRPEVAAAGMLTGSTLVLLPLCLILEGQVDMPTSWGGVASIGYFSLIATAGAYLLYYRILAAAGAGNLLLVTLLIPPVAVLLGAVVLGERLGPNAFVGFGLLALGLTILSRAGRRAALRRDEMPDGLQQG